MLTVIFIAAGAIVLIGLIWLVMQSGATSKRHNQSGQAEVQKQQVDPPSRAQSQGSGSAEN